MKRKKTDSSASAHGLSSVTYAPLQAKKMPDRRFAVCYYPGVVKNADRALDTLGGLSEIAKVLSQEEGPTDGTEKDIGKHLLKTESVDTTAAVAGSGGGGFVGSSSLKLKFDAADPLCHAVVSHVDARTGLVLEVSQERLVTDRRERDSGETCEGKILGVVEKAHRFHALADFLSPEPEMSQRYLTVEPEIDYSLDTFPEDPVDMPLPLWSHVDMPQDYAFKVNMTKPRLRTEGEIDRRFHTNRQQPSHAVDFSVDATAIPSKLTEDDEKTPLEFAVLEQCLLHLFDKRPVWSRDAIEAHLRKLSADTVRNGLKVLLPKLAYYFSTGPWRLLWIRRGYDPRMDPSSCFYQGLDFRVPKWVDVITTAAGHSQFGDSRRIYNIDQQAGRTKMSKLDSFAAELERGVSETNMPVGAPLFEDGVLEQSRVDEAVRFSDDGRSKLSVISREELDEMTAAPSRSSHTFTLPPTQRQELFMLCDVAEGVAEVHALLAKQETQPVCEEHGGWYTRDFLDKIRALMKARLKELLGNGESFGAELDRGGRSSGVQHAGAFSQRPVDQDDTSAFGLLGE